MLSTARIARLTVVRPFEKVDSYFTVLKPFEKAYSYFILTKYFVIFCYKSINDLRFSIHLEY